ncbi:hypothetical protein ACJJTC_014906 [Scirpophaga incertulas]
MPGQRCVLCGRGYGTGTAVHVFPNPAIFPDRFKEWVHIIGGKLETPSDYEFYMKKRICDIHFKDEHKTSCHRLSALAVPSFYLPGSTNNQARLELTENAQILAATSMSTPSQSGPNHTTVLMEHNYSTISRPKQKQPVKANSVHIN